MPMYDYQVYEALLRLLGEQNRRLRETAAALGVTAEQLSANLRDARAARDHNTGPQVRHLQTFRTVPSLEKGSSASSPQ